MKIKVTMKDPDTLGDAITDAIRAELKASGLPEDEQQVLYEVRRDKASEIAGKWFEYGEYLTVEIDTEARTCTVLEK